MYELIVIGGGPAGLAAAREAYDQGLRKILIIERDRELGGILNQCIHNGFGLHYFKEELTGPEYAGRFIKKLDGTSIEVRLDTMALELTRNLKVHAVSRSDGYCVLKARSIILAMGCRERPRGAIGIPGTRPAGIFTAGAAQRYVNMEGYMVGNRVVILGSGDIGLIMARRLTLEGAKVLACVEVMPYSGGLTRNIVQCLDDYDIPLYLSHTITDIQGNRRVERVIVSKVDENRTPIQGSEFAIDCDTVLLSVGLIPENELTRQAGIEIDPVTNGAAVYEDMQTSLPGVFSCGNVAHVHDLVDFVTAESIRAGRAAAGFVLGKSGDSPEAISVCAGFGISYVVPQKIRPSLAEDKVDAFFRVNRVFGKSRVQVYSGGQLIYKEARGHLSPGEMERIALPRTVLTQADKAVEIKIEEVEQVCAK